MVEKMVELMSEGKRTMHTYHLRAKKPILFRTEQVLVSLPNEKVRDRREEGTAPFG
jgi:hypothetical protein